MAGVPSSLPRVARRAALVLSLALPAVRVAHAQESTSAYTLAQVKSYAFPNQLTASASGARVAWALDEQGKRNIWVAEGPAWAPRKLTSWDIDDGQELTSVQLSRDGRWVVFVRGGDHGSNWDDELPVNVLGAPTMPRVQLWAASFDGGTPKVIADGGEEPAISPKSDVVAFVKERAIWLAPLDGSAPARRAIAVKGNLGSPRWSPDGARLAFVADRGDHAFVGVWSGDSAMVQWLAPTTNRDGSPRWSPDGSRIAFVRRPGGGGAPDSLLVPRHAAWGIWVADVASGRGRRLWQAPRTLPGSVPGVDGGTNLHWTGAGKIAFLSYQDGWPHLYAMPDTGGTATLLTPGNYQVEHVSLVPGGRALVASANAGRDPLDIDRRHLLWVPLDGTPARVVTPGSGLEWSPVVTGDGGTLAFISATAQRPPVPAVLALSAGTPPASAAEPRLIAADRTPADFPTAALVTPKQVTFRAADGVLVHAQLFERAGGGRKPAVIFVHGGPPRQMLLGWHYSDYYSNAYAVNQYLASRGFAVLSVNYRLGIGYGYEFQRPANAGAQGASEYQDVVAAAHWLRAQPGVDGSRIGIWGGSYGGFLTAMALARNSDLFAAGADLHGVHDWTTERARGMLDRTRYERAADADRALEVAWRSSPLSSLAGWRSPVLLVHGDEDRNVRFNQTVDLARRLERQGVPFEELVIPDDTHHFLRHAHWLAVDGATADFLERVLIRREKVAAR